ncbi:MAG: hypothetical protein M1549_01335 [Candidatus Dependentiae bacterium]|nr:hypothetical protein [Candidatus Dependentiae bacterium]
MKRIILILTLPITAISPSLADLHANDSSWGWTETVVAGAALGAGVALAGKAIREVSKGISSSWNHSYVSAVSTRIDRLSEQYDSLAREIVHRNKREVASLLSDRYRSVERMLHDLNWQAKDFDQAISNLRGKLDEWRLQDERAVMYCEGLAILDHAMPLQRILHKTDDTLQAQRFYFILYDIARHSSPQLDSCERYPYHALLKDLEGAKTELQSAIRKLENCWDLDHYDRDLLDKTTAKLRALSRHYVRVLESAQYHHEKLEKLRAERHRELLEAQRRLAEAEREMADAIHDLAQSERQRTYAEWERRQSKVERLLRELNDIEDMDSDSDRPSYDSLELSVHIDL